MSCKSPAWKTGRESKRFGVNACIGRGKYARVPYSVLTVSCRSSDYLIFISRPSIVPPQQSYHSPHYKLSAIRLFISDGTGLLLSELPIVQSFKMEAAPTAAPSSRHGQRYVPILSGVLGGCGLLLLLGGFFYLLLRKRRQRLKHEGKA